MTESSALPPKKDVALALLERATVFVHLDPRGDAVRVPPWFKKQPQLVLQLGLNMPVPIPDLNVDDEGLSCTLSFSRSPHFCLVPWSAVYALVGEDGRGMVWPDDVPGEVVVQTRAAPKAQRSLRPVSSTQSPKRSRRRSKTSKRPQAGRSEPAQSSESRAQARLSTESQAPQQHEKPKSATVSDDGVTNKGKRPLPPYLRVVK